MVLNNAIDIRFGEKQVSKVYKNNEVVWEKKNSGWYNVPLTVNYNNPYYVKTLEDGVEKTRRIWFSNRYGGSATGGIGACLLKSGDIYYVYFGRTQKQSSLSGSRDEMGTSYDPWGSLYDHFNSGSWKGEQFLIGSGRIPLTEPIPDFPIYQTNEEMLDALITTP